MIERLGAATAAQRESLAALLVACVAGGASVGFETPLALDVALRYWTGVAADVAAGRAILLGARDGERLVGTVQLRPSAYPNGRHRADVAKLLVDPGHRRAGLGRRLMAAIEAAAIAEGKWLLVLDTVPGSVADGLYRSLGWREVGSIPDFAYSAYGELAPTTIFFKVLPKS